MKVQINNGHLFIFTSGASHFISQMNFIREEDSASLSFARSSSGPRVTGTATGATGFGSFNEFQVQGVRNLYGSIYALKEGQPLCSAWKNFLPVLEEMLNSPPQNHDFLFRGRQDKPWDSHFCFGTPVLEYWAQYGEGSYTSYPATREGLFQALNNTNTLVNADREKVLQRMLQLIEAKKIGLVCHTSAGRINLIDTGAGQDLSDLYYQA